MNFAPRVLLIVVLIAAGFILPFLWLGAAIVAFTLYADTRPVEVRTEDGRFPNTTGDDPDWRVQMRKCVESPAEEAFLNIMIDHFDLKPQNRSLQGNGLTLRMQVEALRYRLDFLVDEALVVEIDGAEWHCSPEAMARDQKRDQELVEAGYTVVRIPAKIALYDHEKAIDLVEGMRAKAKKVREQFNDARQSSLRHALKPTTIIRTAAEQTSKAAKLMEELTATAERHLAEQKAREVDPIQIKAVMDQVAALIAEIRSETSVLRASEIPVVQDHAKAIDVSVQEIAGSLPHPETRTAAIGRLGAAKKLLASVREFSELEAKLASDPVYRKIYEDVAREWDELDTRKD